MSERRREVMQPSRPVLMLDHVSFSYGERAAVQEVTFGCPVGVTALLGPNGAGKTTLLRLAATARRVRSGSISIEAQGEVVRAGRGAKAYRCRVGWLPQGFTAPGGFTVRELVTYAAWLKGRSSRSSASLADDALAFVGLLERADDKVRTLSGGMLQRLGIAQAVVHEPQVLLLDEPTVGLDPDQRASFRRLVQEIGRSTAVLVSTHLTEDVERMCDRVVVLDDGSVRFEGSLQAFLDRADGALPSGSARGERAYRAVVQAEG